MPVNRKCKLALSNTSSDLDMNNSTQTGEPIKFQFSIRTNIPLVRLTWVCEQETIPFWYFKFGRCDPIW